MLNVQGWVRFDFEQLLKQGDVGAGQLQRVDFGESLFVGKRGQMIAEELKYLNNILQINIGL